MDIYRNRQTSRVTALTRVLPEETLCAPKVLPDECWISFKIIYKYFIQGLRPVNPVHYVRICGEVKDVDRGTERKEKKTSKLNGVNGNHPALHYRVHVWPLSLIDPPGGDTMPVTKSSPPLLLLDDPAAASLCAVNRELWGVHYSNTKAATERGDTLSYETRSEWTATIRRKSFPPPPSPLSALFTESLRGLQFLSLYVWTAIDPPNSTSPSLWHWYSFNNHFSLSPLTLLPPSLLPVHQLAVSK